MRIKSVIIREKEDSEKKMEGKLVNNTPKGLHLMRYTELQYKNPQYIPLKQGIIMGIQALFLGSNEEAGYYIFLMGH